MPKGEWITGGNWDHENWPSKKHPRKEMIDRHHARPPGAGLAPRRPHGPGQLAGPEAGRHHPRHARPPGRRDRQGQEDRRAHRHPARQRHGPGRQGHPAAVPRQARAGHPRRHAPCPGAGRDQRPGQQLAPRTWQIYQDLLAQGRAGRAHQCLARRRRLGRSSSASASPPPYGDPFLRLGTVKLFVDGSMGAGTALFFEPYADDPATSGLPIHTQAELEALVMARRHAPGCRSRPTPSATRPMPGSWMPWPRPAPRTARRDARHRIEHSQVVRAEDVARFKELGVIASIQPSHCIDDMRWAEKRIGARVGDAYRFASFLQAGVRLAFGTDWDVEPLDPRLGLYAAVSRELARRRAGRRLASRREAFPGDRPSRRIRWARPMPNSRRT